MNDELTNLRLSTLRNAIGQRVEDYKINVLGFMPHSQKYTVTIEVKVGEKVHILHSNQTTISKVADDLAGQYYGLAFCYSQGCLRKAQRVIERHFQG
jgi:hypothetical protein